MVLGASTAYSIENNFWSTDKTALNILLDKLEYSNKTTIAIQEFFNERVRIEEEYGSQLLKLSQLFTNNTQHEDSFDIISHTTEMTARAHIDLSQNIKNLLELPLNDFLKGQEHVKHYMTNQMKESQNMKLLHGDNVKKTQRLYINECQKAHPSKKDVEILDFEYEQAVKLMQLNSSSWIHDWRESCKTFQSLESNRIEYLRALIKTYSTMLASTYNIDDQTCDRLNATMDDLNSEEEIRNFIINYGTGSTIPEVPKYTKFRRSSFRTDISEGKDSELLLQPQTVRAIKEIVIPNNHDEQLRSVNDQLKKIPSPWGGKSDTPAKTEQPLYPSQQYPLHPLYKSNKKNPSKSDPVLNNFMFQKENNHQMKNNNDLTLVTPHEEKVYEPIAEQKTRSQQHIPPWNDNSLDKRVPERKASTATTTDLIHTQMKPSHKKTSLFLSPLNFLKKKKIVSSEDSPHNHHHHHKTRNHNKKRLSLGYVSTTSKKSAMHQNTNDMPLVSPTRRNSSSTILTPSSPMFSQIDFYFSPSNSDINHVIVPSQQQQSSHIH